MSFISDTFVDERRNYICLFWFCSTQCSKIVKCLWALRLETTFFAKYSAHARNFCKNNASASTLNPVMTKCVNLIE